MDDNTINGRTDTTLIVGHYSPAEIELKGGPTALRALAERLRQANALTTLELWVPADYSAAPYDGFLTELRIWPADHRVTITATHKALEISGTAASLGVLADNIDWIADKGAEAGGSHIHVEPYADHPYLSPESVPLIVTVEPSG